MDVAVIDWKSVDSRFVRDELYENIRAPKWVDFASGDDPVDDVAWFCKPGCDHPKTAEDFKKKMEVTQLPNLKHKKLASVSEISPFGDANIRDPKLKKRTLRQPLLSIKGQKYHTDVEDDENRDPNLSHHPCHSPKPVKESVTSFTGKQFGDINTPGSESKKTKLRSTMSAKNLFSGGDFLNKVADFCTELKRLATGARSRENVESAGKQHSTHETPRDLKEKEKEVKQPWQELQKEKSRGLEITGSNNQPRRKKRIDADIENIPTPILTSKNEDLSSSPQIRMYPPTPQCFSATKGKAMTPSPKPFGSRTQGGGVQTAAEKETGSVDVLWFLKPCTLSG